jgi:hypothetical protein
MNYLGRFFLPFCAIRSLLDLRSSIFSRGFHAPLHDGMAARDFFAKLSETGGVAHGFQLKEVTSDR